MHLVAKELSQKVLGLKNSGQRRSIDEKSKKRIELVANSSGMEKMSQGLKGMKCAGSDT